MKKYITRERLIREVDGKLEAYIEERAYTEEEYKERFEELKADKIEELKEEIEDIKEAIKEADDRD